MKFYTGWRCQILGRTLEADDNIPSTRDDLHKHEWGIVGRLVQIGEVGMRQHPTIPFAAVIAVYQCVVVTHHVDEVMVIRRRSSTANLNAEVTCRQGGYPSIDSIQFEYHTGPVGAISKTVLDIARIAPVPTEFAAGIHATCAGADDLIFGVVVEVAVM